MQLKIGRILCWPAALVIVLGVLVALLAPATQATNNTFQSGDVFVSLSSGNVEWRHPDGTMNRILLGSPLAGPAQGMAFDAGGNLFVTRWCRDLLCTTDTVDRYDTSGSLTGQFGGSVYFDNPMSIVFEATSNALVGQADSSEDILRLSSAGVLLAAFDAAVENRGTAKIDLAGDGCTVYYTSQGSRIFVFNVCAETQEADFATIPFPQIGHALKILPDGGVLVAAEQSIVRFNQVGTVVQTYTMPGEAFWTGLDVGADTNTFWTSNLVSHTVAQFDLSSGAVLQSFVATETPKDVAAKKAPLIIKARGRMTGGGSIFTSAADSGVPPGTRITHGFELHCDKNRKPNRLQINIHDGVRSRFHLTQLTFASCTDDPTIEPNPPSAPFDTYEGRGTGRFNGQDGYTAEWIFTDAGEPGVNDRIKKLIIRDPNGNIVLNIPEPGHTLTFGNHQAHR